MHVYVSVYDSHGVMCVLLVYMTPTVLCVHVLLYMIPMVSCVYVLAYVIPMVLCMLVYVIPMVFVCMC